MLFNFLFLLISCSAVVPDWEIVGYCDGCRYCLMLKGHESPYFCIFSVEEIPCYIRRQIGGTLAAGCPEGCSSSSGSLVTTTVAPVVSTVSVSAVLDVPEEGTDVPVLVKCLYAHIILVILIVAIASLYLHCVSDY